MGTKANLTAKQSLFVNHYLATFNATEAARRAGYNGNDATLAVIGSENLRKPKIAAEISSGFRDMAMPAEEVLARLSAIARSDMADLTNDKGEFDYAAAKERGKTSLVKKVKARRYTTGKGDDKETVYEVEAETHDPLKALQLLAKYHALLVDRVKVDDWRSQAIEAIREGQISYPAAVQAFNDEDLATELFRQAGVPIEAE